MSSLTGNPYRVSTWDADLTTDHLQPKDETMELQLKRAAYDWSNYCVELCSDDGPTGEFVEVTHIAVCDYGGNELARGKAGFETYRGWRIPTQLVAIGTSGVKVAGGNTLCDYANWDANLSHTP